MYIYIVELKEPGVVIVETKTPLVGGMFLFVTPADDKRCEAVQS